MGIIEGGIVMVLKTWRLTQAEAYINIFICLLFTLHAHILSSCIPMCVTTFSQKYNLIYFMAVRTVCVSVYEMLKQRNGKEIKKIHKHKITIIKEMFLMHRTQKRHES